MKDTMIYKEVYSSNPVYELIPNLTLGVLFILFYFLNSLTHKQVLY